MTAEVFFTFMLTWLFIWVLMRRVEKLEQWKREQDCK